MGQSVVVVGLGSVGQLAVQFARLAGASEVIGVDLDADRCKRAVALGADAGIAPEDELLDESLAQGSSHAPAPIFIEVTGASKALEWCITHARLHSRVVVSGTYSQPITFDPFGPFIDNEIEIVGAHHPKCPDTPVTYHPYSKALNIEFMYRSIVNKRLNVDALVDQVFTPQQAVDYFNLAIKGEHNTIQPIINWEDK